MPNLKVVLDGVDVTNWYNKEASAIQIVDGLNQPVTLDLGLTAFRLPTTINGGETISVFDDDRIYFDGVVPVEAGVGTDFLYLDTTASPEVYRKAFRVRAVDYQAVLDYKNLPNQTFYFQTCGSIIRALLAMSPLAPYLDVTDVADGYVIPDYCVAGRKFSNVVKELAAINGFYFCLRTLSLKTDKKDPVFKAEFRSLSDRPAPFKVDRDANGYVLSSLKFEPRDKPLVNKVAIVGGEEPSLDIVTDQFEGDGVHGRFQLSRVPFYMKTSDLLKSDFSQALDSTQVTQLGNAFSAGDVSACLQINGSGALYFNTAFQSRNQRYTTFEDIALDAGADVLFGIFGDRTLQTIGNCRLGVRFRSDGTVTYVKDGVEKTDATGNPTWSPRSSNTAVYAVRIKETTLGTVAEIQGDPISPTRYWFPMQPSGTQSQGAVWVERQTGALVEGTTVSLYLGSVIDVRKTHVLDIPGYPLQASDVIDPSLSTLHWHLTDWLNGNAEFGSKYSASFLWQESAIKAVLSNSPVKVELTEGLPAVVSGASVKIDGCQGNVAPNGTWVVEVDPVNPKILTLLTAEGNDASTYALNSGTVHLPLPKIFIAANGAGSGSNATVHGDVSDNTLQVLGSTVTGGTDSGADYGSTPDYFFTGILASGGSGAIRRIITRDPIGVNAVLRRAHAPVIGDQGPHSGARRAAQMETSITVGSADEVAEHYTAQVVLEGQVAYFSFFDDIGSIPQTGDELVVSYAYGVPIQVVVQDESSVEAVRSRSNIPGDDGVREAADVDVKDKIFSTDSAIRYGQQYLASRSGLMLQGTVDSSSWHTLGSVPLSGQRLQFDLRADSVQRTEAVTSVTTKHLVDSHFDFSVTFGKLPDEFLMTIESPQTTSNPDALTYNVRAMNETLQFQNQITLTVK